MFNIVVERKGKNDMSVTGTYMNIVRKACENTGENTVVLPMGEELCNKKDVIVSDTLNASIRYFIKGCKNQILWVQGVTPEESYMRNQSKIRFWIWNVLEKYVVKHAKMLLMVSDEMLQHYESKYKLSLKEKTVVMPCFNELSIVDDAFSQNKYDENTFTYVGSLHKWQCFEETLSLYSIIEKNSKTPTKLYVYTFEQERAIRLIQQYEIKNVEVSYVDKEQLSEKLKYIKYGFVLRQDCIVNKVATPTKFSNYLSNGIIPIYSDVLKSFAEYDRANNIGIVCNTGQLIEGANIILESMNSRLVSSNIRAKCQAVFEDYYNANNYELLIYRKIKDIFHL